VTCKHEHGDNVEPLMGWVCGQCFTIIGDRPKRYGFINAGLLGFDAVKGGELQEVVWMADILKSAEGTTLGVFLAAIARRFERKGGLDRTAAYAAALDAAKMIEAPFGHPDHDWSRASAIDIADEDMSYWDCDVAGGNG
jgi:hypothetical protein